MSEVRKYIPEAKEIISKLENEINWTKSGIWGIMKKCFNSTLHYKYVKNFWAANYFLEFYRRKSFLVFWIVKFFEITCQFLNRESV
jgi:hypothetical protein